jgi:hypothetical protein
MKKNIKLLSLLLPYLIFTYSEYKDNYLFRMDYFIYFILFIIILDFNMKIKKIFFPSIIFFLLYVVIISDSLLIPRNKINYFFILIFIIIVFKLMPKLVINTFLILLSFNLIIFSKNKIYYKINAKSRLDNIIPEKRINDAMIIILLDEYSAPSEIKIENKLVKYLKKNEFHIIDPVESKEIYTINSISSLLNYNISDNKIFIENLSEIERFELINKSQFEKDLNKIAIKLKLKNYYRVDEINYPVPNYFMSPRNFLELILYKSFIPRIERSILGDYAFEFYNKILINELTTNFKNNNFVNNNIYFYHLAMPHYPYSYFNEYKKNNLYKNYYAFVNDKIISILKNNRNEKLKIIIMGDHGYRGDKNINPKCTFLAYKNINSFKNVKLQYLQDVGNVIIEEYK